MVEQAANSFGISEMDAFESTQQQVVGMLGQLNGPVNVLRDVTGRSKGNVLEDAEWFLRQTPEQLGIMKGRRIVSKRGVRALQQILQLTEEDPEHHPDPRGRKGKRHRPALSELKGSALHRSRLSSKGSEGSGSNAHKRQLGRRGRTSRRVFGESTSHLDGVAAEFDTQAGAAIDHATSSSPESSKRTRYGLRGPRGRRKARTWDEDRESVVDGVRRVGLASTRERRQDAVQAGIDREFLESMLGTVEKGDLGEEELQSFQHLQQHLQSLGGGNDPSILAQAAGLSKAQASGLERAIMEASGLGGDGSDDDGVPLGGGRQ